MTFIVFDDQKIELSDGQTVLSALLDQGFDIPNSCQAGACQTCMMQVKEGEIPAKAQAGLKDTLKAQGYFLACNCTPQKPLNITACNAAKMRTSAKVVAHDALGTDVMRLRVKPAEPFTYHPGQYLTIWKTETIGRSYSIASVADFDHYVELHIRRVKNGVVSRWLYDNVAVGESIQIQQATGNCFYTHGNPEQNILLAGTGTGLAPLIGVARDALQHDHSGAIHLIHGASTVDDLYMHQTLVKMAQLYSNFYYYACVRKAERVSLPVTGESIQTIMMSVAAVPAQWKVYLCGGPNMVSSLKKAIFLAGASMKNIYSDPFITSHSS
ncbi:MAG: 2Fe-2S iron-sulfur cluster binding domain-containing protein [Pseudomonadales bacterium]|nr:2Fe-2S iron-sulfur cluster binding domain-containing protein [Pseudomonadales bacterium]